MVVMVVVMVMMIVVVIDDWCYHTHTGDDDDGEHCCGFMDRDRSHTLLRTGSSPAALDRFTHAHAHRAHAAARSVWSVAWSVGQFLYVVWSVYGVRMEHVDSVDGLRGAHTLMWNDDDDDDD